MKPKRKRVNKVIRHRVNYRVKVGKPIRWFLYPIHLLNVPIHILARVLGRIFPKGSPLDFVANRVFIRFVIGSVVLTESFFWEAPPFLHHAVWEYSIEFVRAAGVTPIVDGFLVLLKVAEEVA